MGYFALLAMLIFGSVFVWQLVVRPWWYSERQQRERAAQQVADMLAEVLHRGFDYSHVVEVEGSETVHYVRFLTPLGLRLRLAGDGDGNDHPDSYLAVWDWSISGLKYLPIASIYLELDLYHIPYDHTIDWLVDHHEDIEIEAGAALMSLGVKRVKLRHIWLQDRRQQRVIFRIVYRERKKNPAIPQHVSFDEMATTWAEFEAGKQEYNRVEQLERERLAARLLDYGIKHFNGTFPLKKLQEVFASEISHRQIETLGRTFEARGILEHLGGPKPRQINLSKAKDFIQAHLEIPE